MPRAPELGRSAQMEIDGKWGHILICDLNRRVLGDVPEILTCCILDDQASDKYIVQEKELEELLLE